mmetsp:Transcript_22138/g.22452  ORF Transcript_22138/g.22452 Transcript_22138/m.22452 type:complete len:80 (+) Transcript_22138:890-1129(+)
MLFGINLVSITDAATMDSGYAIQYDWNGYIGHCVARDYSSPRQMGIFPANGNIDRMFLWFSRMLWYDFLASDKRRKDAF